MKGVRIQSRVLEAVWKQAGTIGDVPVSHLAKGS